MELYQQTNARLWRQGQRADTVVIHHIIAENTIDEQIMDALERKDTTQTLDRVFWRCGNDERKGISRAGVPA